MDEPEVTRECSTSPMSDKTPVSEPSQNPPKRRSSENQAEEVRAAKNPSRTPPSITTEDQAAEAPVRAHSSISPSTSSWKDEAADAPVRAHSSIFPSTSSSKDQAAVASTSEHSPNPPKESSSKDQATAGISWTFFVGKKFPDHYKNSGASFAPPIEAESLWETAFLPKENSWYAMHKFQLTSEMATSMTQLFASKKFVEQADKSPTDETYDCPVELPQPNLKTNPSQSFHERLFFSLPNTMISFDCEEYYLNFINAIISKDLCITKEEFLDFHGQYSEDTGYKRLEAADFEDLHDVIDFNNHYLLLFYPDNNHDILVFTSYDEIPRTNDPTTENAEQSETAGCSSYSFSKVVLDQASINHHHNHDLKLQHTVNEPLFESKEQYDRIMQKYSTVTSMSWPPITSMNEEYPQHDCQANRKKGERVVLEYIRTGCGHVYHVLNCGHNIIEFRCGHRYFTNSRVVKNFFLNHICSTAECEDNRRCVFNPCNVFVVVSNDRSEMTLKNCPSYIPTTEEEKNKVDFTIIVKSSFQDVEDRNLMR